MKKVNLTEGEIEFQCDFSEADFSEWSQDKGGVVKNVVWLGAKSKNGYQYTEDAMKAAVPKFENIPLFLNHPGFMAGRDIGSLAGKGVKAKFEDGRIKGEAHLLPDAQGQKFQNIARHMPEVAGMSQVAEGKKEIRGGKTFVHEITKVHSVDLVASPATTKSMFEDELRRKELERKTTMDLTEATIHDVKGKLPQVAAELVAEGASSRDVEIDTLTTERDSLKAEVDGMKTKVAEAELSQKVTDMLTESDLTDEQVSDTFRKALTLAEDDDMRKAMIADRIESAKPAGVQNSGPNSNDKTLDFQEAAALLRTKTV